MGEITRTQWVNSFGALAFSLLRRRIGVPPYEGLPGYLFASTIAWYSTNSIVNQYSVFVSKFVAFYSKLGLNLERCSRISLTRIAAVEIHRFAAETKEDVRSPFIEKLCVETYAVPFRYPPETTLLL